MKDIGYKNEKILVMSIDFLIVSLAAVLLYFATGFPHFFNYFSEIDKAQSIISFNEYNNAMEIIFNRFDVLIFEISSLYFIYESVGLIIFKTTFGRKVFHLNVDLNFKSNHDLLLRLLIIPARTLVKILSIITMIPMLIIGAVFLFGRNERTLIDVLLLTKIVHVSQ